MFRIYANIRTGGLRKLCAESCICQIDFAFQKTLLQPFDLKNSGTSEQNAEIARNLLPAYRFFLFRCFLFCGTNWNMCGHLRNMCPQYFAR